MQGRTVVEQRAVVGTGITHFDISQLPAGLYEVQLFDGKQLTRQRLVKE